MKKIRTLLVRFDNELAHYEVSAFRGAVIEKVGRENVLFNHHLDDNKYLFKYPLIQYKSIRKKPAVFCLGEGVDEIHKLFNQQTWEINLKGEQTELKIDQLNLDSFTLNIGDKSKVYQLKNWIALNTGNYRKYITLESDNDKLEMLESILIGNVLSFAKGMNWDVKKEIKVRILSVDKVRNIKYKNTKLFSFDVTFNSNVLLPSYIGLGKGVSRGYGILKRISENNKN